jgi:YD repeat-containing protein
VALAQDPATGLIHVLFDQHKAPADTYIVGRTSTDGVNWTTQTTLGYDRASSPNGQQYFSGRLPILIPSSMQGGASMQVTAGSLGIYGTACWGEPNSGVGTGPIDPTNPTGEPPNVPLGTDPRVPPCPTEPCGQVGNPVNAMTGQLWTAATDLVVPARGLALVVGRTYNSFDGAAAQAGAFGYGWSWTYGVRAITQSDGSVTIVEANGRRAHFWKSGSTWTPGPNINAALTAAMGGGYVLTRHDQSVWTFAADGRLTSIADRNGNTQTLTYAGNTLASIAAAGGRTLTITTNAQGQVTQISASGGLSSSYTYDGSGRLATATDAAGAVTTYTYNNRHLLLTVVDGNGHTVESNTYGTLARVLEQRDAANQLTRFSYAKQHYGGSYIGSDTIVTDPRGNWTRYANDANWRLTERTVNQGHSVTLERLRWTYTSNGDVASFTDGNNRVYSYTYDSRGNVLTATADAGTGGLNLLSSFTYNSTNDLLTATDPLGHTWTFTYSGQGNQLTATDALNNTSTYTYDAVGQLLTATDATGRTTTYGYSATGDVTSITVPGGAMWTVAYDGAGRPTSVTDPLLHTTTIAMDGMGRVTAVTNGLN